jgi:hypothetical protein
MHHSTTVVRMFMLAIRIGIFVLPSPSHAQSVRPIPSLHGTTGLWRILTTDTVPARHAAYALSFDRNHRNPGALRISTLGVAAAVGITDRLEGAVHVEAYRHVRAGRQEQLSFGQQALGFFGDKTPGSQPLASELMPGSSRVPQLRLPPAPSGALSGRAGYYNLLPFAGLVEAAGSVGLVTLNVKYQLLSETRGMPLGVAVHSYFSVPIRKGIEYLMTHPVGTADLHFGFDGIVSKDIGDRGRIHWNAGFRHISQPAHASVFRLADEVPVGVGFIMPRDGRMQFVIESAAEVFIGSHTPNTTFGPADPVDITGGIRMHFDTSFSFTAVYQRPLQSGGGKHGFALSLSYHTPGS